MPEILIDEISKPIVERLESKANIFSMFRSLDTGPEEWFRVEILEAIHALSGISIVATNQRYGDIPGRPDFVLQQGDDEKIVELKVLPVDRNYTSGYQRFCAGKTNKADFDALSNGEIASVIYVHWPSYSDFERTKERLERRYTAKCHSSYRITSEGNEVTVSFWVGGGA